LYQKNILVLILYTEYKAYPILSTCTNQCHWLHLHSQCLHLPCTHYWRSHPVHCHSQHTTHSPIHCHGQTALLKTLCTHFWWDV